MPGAWLSECLQTMRLGAFPFEQAVISMQAFYRVDSLQVFCKRLQNMFSPGPEGQNIIYNIIKV